MEREYQELIDFRKNAKAKVDPKELTDLAKAIGRQESDVGKDSAEFFFEEKCLDQFKLMCTDLKEAGYKELVVSCWSNWSNMTELRAFPKAEFYPPLFRIAKKYFPELTSCGGDAQSDMQGLELRFPARLMGKHEL